MILLQLLLESYEVVQQTLLATIDFLAVTPATIANIHARILSEELHQGTSTNICWNYWNFLKSDLLIFDLLKEKKEEKKCYFIIIIVYFYLL